MHDVPSIDTIQFLTGSLAGHIYSAVLCCCSTQSVFLSLLTACFVYVYFTGPPGRPASRLMGHFLFKIKIYLPTFQLSQPQGQILAGSQPFFSIHKHSVDIHLSLPIFTHTQLCCS